MQNFAALIKKMDFTEKRIEIEEWERRIHEAEHLGRMSERMYLLETLIELNTDIKIKREIYID